MKNQKTASDPQRIAQLLRFVEMLCKNKYKVSYKHSQTTNTYYIILQNENVRYDLRFSDHKSKGNKMRTFYFKNLNDKIKLEKFIKKSIRGMELKQVKYLFEKIA